MWERMQPRKASFDGCHGSGAARCARGPIDLWDWMQPELQDTPPPRTSQGFLASNNPRTGWPEPRLLHESMSLALLGLIMLPYI